MWPHRRHPTRLHGPRDSPGKNTGVGYHLLLQCMKVKSESEVTQSCLTLRDPMDCTPPGSSPMGFSRQEYWSGLPLPSPNTLLLCIKVYLIFKDSLWFLDNLLTNIQIYLDALWFLKNNENVASFFFFFKGHYYFSKEATLWNQQKGRKKERKGGLTEASNNFIISLQEGLRSRAEFWSR